MSNDLVGAVAGTAWAPSDTAYLPRVPRGFQVAVAGNVALEYPDGSIVVWPGCVAGIIHPHFRFTKIRATGTTATGIVVAF